MKILYTLLLTATLLTATEFTDPEKGTLIGVGFAAAQQINMNDKEARKSDTETQKKLCAEVIQNNSKLSSMISSFKQQKEAATQNAIAECVENLQKLN